MNSIQRNNFMMVVIIIENTEGGENLSVGRIFPPNPKGARFGSLHNL